MKNRVKQISILSVIAIAILVLILNCSSGVESDPCEDTIVGKLTIQVNYIVKVEGRINLYERRLLANSILDIENWKSACDNRNVMAFEQNEVHTDNNGEFRFTVSYSLTNSKDNIICKIDVAPGVLISNIRHSGGTFIDFINYEKAYESGGTLNRTFNILCTE